MVFCSGDPLPYYFTYGKSILQENWEDGYTKLTTPTSLPELKERSQDYMERLRSNDSKCSVCIHAYQLGGCSYHLTDPNSLGPALVQISESFRLVK